MTAPMSSPWAVVRRHLRPDRRRLVLALGAVLASSGIVALGPVVVRYGIDQGIEAGDRTDLRVAVAAAAGLLVAGGLISGLRALLMVSIGQRLLHRLRTGAVAGVLSLDLAAFETRSRGDLQARLTSDVESLSGASEDLLPDVVRDAVLVLGGLVALGVLAPPLLLLAVLVLPPAVVAGRWLVARSRIVYPALLAQNGVGLGTLTEVIEGAPTIAALRASRGQAERLRGVDRTLESAALAAAAMRNRFYAALLVLQSAGTAAVVVGAGILVADDRVSVGTAAAAVLAVAGVYGPLSLLIGRLDDLLTAGAALSRIVELQDVPASSSAGEPLPVRGAARMEDVTYTYPGAPRPAVAAISLAVAPGEHVALVGATGSGKSTIARLMAGLAEPDDGRVSFGGVDLRAAARDDRRARLLLLPQESFLTAGSVADNARLAHPSLPDEVVEAAVDRLGLRPWVDSLPDGIRTEVGPSGGRLSAGERQLVALLRVAVADPGLVVLDEATSVLDPASEATVAEAMSRVCAGRAAVVVAHRSATAERCDRIVVMDAGRVVEDGAPADLVAAGGPYARLRAAGDESRSGEVSHRRASPSLDGARE